MLSSAVLLVGYNMAFTSMDLTDQHRLAGTITAITTQQTKGSKPIPGSKDLMLQVDSNDTEYLT